MSKTCPKLLKDDPFLSVLFNTKYHLLTLLILWTVTGFAQSTTFSTTDFLSTALQHPHLQRHQNIQNYLQNTNHELPVLKKLEFRTETNDFDIQRQEYTLRFDFSTQKERTAQRSLHQSNINYYATEQQLWLEETLEKRYKTLVELYYQERLIATREQQKLVYQDKLTVLQKSIQSTDFDIDELIETEEDLQELEQELLERQVENQQLQQSIQAYLPLNTSFYIDKQNWLQAEDIQQRLDNFHPDTMLSRPITERRQAQVHQIEQAYQLEKAESENLINFGQFKYQGGNNEFYKHFSVGMGIILPLKNRSLLDLNELELDRLRTNNRLEEERLEIRQAMQKERAKMDLLLQQYQLLQNQIKDNQTSYTLEQYQKIEGISPLSLLKLKEILLKKDWTILKIEYDLFQTYVQWMALSGQMMELPLRDYLSKDLKLLR